MSLVSESPVAVEQTPFDDLGVFLGLPSIAGLLLSPDGTRLIIGVIASAAGGNAYHQSLWEVDPTGDAPARRITHSAAGEHAVAFLPNGDLLFISGRPGVERAAGGDSALWLLPAGGGEARPLAARPGGIGTNVSVASRSDTVVVASPTMPSAVTENDDRRLRALRRAHGVSAVLHEANPVRYGEQDLGPDQWRLFAGLVVPEEPLDLRGLTDRPGGALRDASIAVSPDGRTVATTWTVSDRGHQRPTVVLIDTASGERTAVLDDPDAEYLHVSYSPDGKHLAAIWESLTTPTQPPSRRLVVVEARAGGRSRVLHSWDRWPSSKPVWSPDGRSMYVTADDHGRSPVFRVDLDDNGSDDVVRLTMDDGAYTDLQIGPDGNTLFALRSTVDTPPVPVRLDAREPGLPATLLVPVPEIPPRGTLTEITTTASDGTPLRAWLALPERSPGDRPAPLLVWLHGGPYASWTGWSWRWNPWLMTARGYAVVMPDPGLSTGYGDSFATRGWGAWGGEPYTDVLALTDAAEARPDVSADSTVVMGGSFGGYLANWIAGHTDRFVAIVSHAGIWALDQFGPTSDLAFFWMRELTPDRHLNDSPHQFVDSIRTPMLLAHSGRDFRVPLTESLRMWFELQAAAADTEIQHRFLYFPNENHAVSAPQHIKIWFDTVFAFLDSTVHGLPFEAPEILG